MKKRTQFSGQNPPLQYWSCQKRKATPNDAISTVFLILFSGNQASLPDASFLEDFQQIPVAFGRHFLIGNKPEGRAVDAVASTRNTAMASSSVSFGHEKSQSVIGSGRRNSIPIYLGDKAGEQRAASCQQSSSLYAAFNPRQKLSDYKIKIYRIENMKFD